jgi:IS5 family transposase
MADTPRFQSTGKGSFFGDYVYRQVVDRRHFLVALNELVDWSALGAHLLDAYKGRGRRGRPRYDPVLTFKMLFISYLYGVSERQVEELSTYHLAVKYFLGLAIDEAAPDHATRTQFKNRLLDRGGWEAFRIAFEGLLQQARAQGLEIGTLQVLDSVHTQADVNLQKDRDRQEEGRPPRDPDAQVVHKGTRQVVEPDGARGERVVRYRGYKSHVAVNAASGLVTAVVPARGHTADNKAFPAVRAQDRAQGLPVTTYGGDRAYDDTDIYGRLEAEGLSSAICLNDYRTQKKDAHQEPWRALEADEAYQAAKAQRYRVEQPFGIATSQHGFERCRYVGLRRYGIQAYLTFLVHDAKRIVKLLVGLTFRPQAKGRRRGVFTPVYATIPWAQCV